MNLLRKTRVHTGRLNEILGTVNTNVVNTVFVEGFTNSWPPKFNWAEVTVGSTKYVVELIDIDPRYADDEVTAFINMLASHENRLNIKIRDFIFNWSAPDKWDIETSLKKEYEAAVNKMR